MSHRILGCSACETPGAGRIVARRCEPRTSDVMLMGRRRWTGRETDAAIIRASINDPEVFGELFSRHGDRMYRFLQQRTGVTAAEDLLGDVFCAAFSARSNYDFERESSLPWLYGIALNILRRHFRTSSRRTNLETRVRLDRVPQRAEDELVAASLDARDLLRRVNAALSPDERDLLELVAWEGLTFKEASEALGVPAGTLRSRMTRVRKKLRKLLAESAEMPESTSRREGDAWTS